MYLATWKLVLIGLVTVAMLLTLMDCWKDLDEQDNEIIELKKQIKQMEKGGTYEL